VEPYGRRWSHRCGKFRLTGRYCGLVERILVSACLLGQPVRYDGTGRRSDDRLFEQWRAEGRLVPFCPEVRGGLPVPRAAAEISGGLGGDVLDGRARVLTRDGSDVTPQFVEGARQALEQARSYGIRLAILKEGSPSCGGLRVHDGTFSGHKIPGHGVTTALLQRNGITVFSEDALEAAAAHLAALER
jgi:uncharacterized protein YbbK (DUF523 family)